jgi:hypothetical protein
MAELQHFVNRRPFNNVVGNIFVGIIEPLGLHANILKNIFVDQIHIFKLAHYSAKLWPGETKRLPAALRHLSLPLSLSRLCRASDKKDLSNYLCCCV